MKNIATKHFTKWLNWFDRDSEEFTTEINEFIHTEQQRDGVANLRIIDIKYTVNADPFRKEEPICSFCQIDIDNTGVCSPGESHACECEEEEPMFLMTALLVYEFDIIKTI